MNLPGLQYYIRILGVEIALRSCSINSDSMSDTYCSFELLCGYTIPGFWEVVLIALFSEFTFCFDDVNILAKLPMW